MPRASRVIHIGRLYAHLLEVIFFFDRYFTCNFNCSLRPIIVKDGAALKMHITLRGSNHIQFHFSKSNGWIFGGCHA